MPGVVPDVLAKSSGDLERAQGLETLVGPVVLVGLPVIPYLLVLLLVLELDDSVSVNVFTVSSDSTLSLAS